MKHLLIPTDFSIRSLNAVHAAITHYDEDKLRITLFHLLSMPVDISDLLFASRRNKHYEIVGNDFNEACEVLQNRYSSRLHAMSVKFGFGSTGAYVRNFLAGELVDYIVVCPDTTLSLPSKRSVPMMPLLHKSGVPVVKIAVPSGPRGYSDINVMDRMILNTLKTQEAQEYVVEK